MPKWSLMCNQFMERGMCVSRKGGRGLEVPQFLYIALA